MSVPVWAGCTGFPSQHLCARLLCDSLQALNENLVWTFYWERRVCDLCLLVAGLAGCLCLFVCFVLGVLSIYGWVASYWEMPWPSFPSIKALSLLPLKNNSPQTLCCNSSSVNLIVQSDYLVKKSVLFNLVNSVHFKLNISLFFYDLISCYLKFFPPAMYSSVALLSFAGLLLWSWGEHGTQILFPQNFCGCEVVAQVLDTP